MTSGLYSLSLWERGKREPAKTKPSHRLQDLLEDTTDSGDGKGFLQAARATLLQETFCFRRQCIPCEEDNALAEVWLLLRQDAVQSRAVEFRHPHITQEQVIGALLE